MVFVLLSIVGLFYALKNKEEFCHKGTEFTKRRRGKGCSSQVENNPGGMLQKRG